MKKTGDNYYDSEEFHDMLAGYEQAVEEGQPVFLDADELSEIAEYYKMTGQDDEAERAIELALGLSPGAIAPLTYRIHEALWQGDTALARSYLNQIVERDEPDYVYNQGEILIAEGHADEADKFFRKEFRKVPPDEYQDYVIDVAHIFQDYEENELAMQWMARAKHEDTPEFKDLMARTLFGLGKYKDSERLFNELVDEDPFSNYYWTALASAQFMNEDYSASVESSEYAIAIDPEDAEGIIAKANALHHLNNYEEALKYYQRYSEHVPDDEFSQLQQGICLINLKRNDEAIDVLEKTLERLAAPDAPFPAEESPYLADMLQELAFAYSEKGLTEKAMECLAKTDDLDCDHVQAHVIKGHVLLAADRLEEAEEEFRQAVVTSDDPYKALLRVIVSIYDNRFVEASYQLFLKYFRMVPADCTDGFAYMALCCYDMKRTEEFLHYLKEACRLNPSECREVLSFMFPAEVEPQDYYTYVINNMKRFKS